MKLLLDTHAVVWWWIDDSRLPNAARLAITKAGNEVLVSAASAWEIATKYRLGNWPEVAPIAAGFADLLRRSRFNPLPITVSHALRSGMLPGEHRDPFDRMLIAQAEEQKAVVVSRDAVFRRYNVSVIWDIDPTAAST